MNFKSRAKILGAVGAVLIGIQFIPIERTNPPVTGEVEAPEGVKQILQRSCYDCHSNQTRWPWYSRVAPVSWLIAHDVEEGREHLNFSEWNRLDASERSDLIEEIWEEVEEGEMPLWIYPPLHPEARIGDAERTTLREWSRRVSNVTSDP